MFAKKSIRLPSNLLQAAVSDFTLSQRFWTAHAVHKIEHMLKFYGILPAGYLYERFDPDTEEAIFTKPPFSDEENWPRELPEITGSYKELREVVLKQLKG